MTQILTCQSPYQHRLILTQTPLSSSVSILARPRTYAAWTLFRDLMTATGVNHFVHELDETRTDMKSTLAARFQTLGISTITIGQADNLNHKQFEWVLDACRKGGVDNILLLHGLDTSERIYKLKHPASTTAIPWRQAKRLLPKRELVLPSLRFSNDNPDYLSGKTHGPSRSHLNLDELRYQLREFRVTNSWLLQRFFYENVRYTDDPDDALQFIAAIREQAIEQGANITLNEQALWHVVNEAQHRPMTESELFDLWQVSNPGVAAAAVLIDAQIDRDLDSLTVKDFHEIAGSGTGHPLRLGRKILEVFARYHEIRKSSMWREAFDPVGRQLTKALREVSLNLNLPLQIGPNRDGRRTVDIYEWIGLEWISS